MLGINQTVVFALFMVIIGAFIGLAVDNLIRTWANKRKKLLGLEEY